MTNKIKKKDYSLYFKLGNGEYQDLGKAISIDDRYLIADSNMIIAAQKDKLDVLYIKDKEYMPIELQSDWLLTERIAIAKIKKPNKKKEDNFTSDDFQNALKKVSRKVDKKEKK